MAAVSELATTAGIQVACQALALPRASFYRKLHPCSSASPVSRRRPARALGPQEKATVLACLHEERFQDRSPAAVVHPKRRTGRLSRFGGTAT
jgi:putative transposase